jgi:uncharacterized SAM-binding protein YcdF (DUF218 family)
MFFYLSKTVGYLLLPSNLLIALAVIGALLLATRFSRFGRRLLVTAVVLMALLGFLPVGAALMMPLEDRFPDWQPTAAAPDGIIVLGGALDPNRSLARDKPVFTLSAERISMAAELAGRYPNARVVFTGGTGKMLIERIPESEFAGPLLERLGVQRERLMVEGRSRNTVENAVYTAALIDPKPGQRWLLVTSASHMPRAVGCFRRAGVPVEAVPVDRRIDRRMDLYPAVSLAEGLTSLDGAAREWIGLFVYWITGRTSELFPGPR